MKNTEMAMVALSMCNQKNELERWRWSSDEWEKNTSRLIDMIRVEGSAFRLGDIFWMDVDFDVPVDAIRAVYLRLFELGAADVRTKLCYANYLRRYSPTWDDEANEILSSIEDIAREAGFWDSPVHGHHPVFFNPRHLAGS